MTASNAVLLASFAGQISVAPIYGTDSGTANAYVLSAPSTFSLTVGALVRFNPAHPNNGPSTANVGGSGVQNIVNQAGNALTGGELSVPTWIQWTGSSWQIVGTGPTPANARTAAEISAAVTPVNYAYPVGHAWRYGADPSGTVDCTSALQSAINIALATVNSTFRIYIPAGLYKMGGNNAGTDVALTFGPSTTAMLSLEIYGDGDLTQILNNYAPNTKPLFNLTGKNGIYLHDFLQFGQDATKNDGIYLGTTGGTEQIHNRVERVTSMMVGQGLRLADTNNDVIRQFRSWPNNPPTLHTTQTVTRSNIKEHIICTGGFVNFVTFRDIETPCSTGFGGLGAFVINCTDSESITIDGLDVETYDGTQGTGFLANPGSFVAGLKLSGVYCETSLIQISNTLNSDIGPFSDGEVGGLLQLQSTNRGNTFTGVRVAGIKIIDSQSWGNTFLGCVARTDFVDGTEGANLSGQPNRYIGCTLWNGTAAVQCADLGNNWRTLLTYSSSMTIDVMGPSMRVIRVTNGSPFSIAIAHARNGQQIRVVLHNESSGSMGTPTWLGIFTPTTVPLPAPGFNRTYGMHYDSDFSCWRMDWWSPADVANG